MFENRKIRLITTMRHRYRHLAWCGAILLIVSSGCARTAPLGNETDTSDSNDILRSSDDSNSMDSDTLSVDTYTEVNTEMIDATDSHTDTPLDSDDVVDTASFEGSTDSHSGEDSATAFDRDTQTDDTQTNDTQTDDTGAATDSDSLSPECNCNAHQWCQKSVGKCWCLGGYTGKDCLECDSDEGYVEWPQKEGVCVPERCSEVVCDGDAVCRIDDEGRPSCDCPAGLTGAHCRQQWQTLLVPPFASDVVFDSDDNGWFATDQGVLYWQFNNTPEDTSDDTTLWYVSDNFTKVNTIAIDQWGRKWMGLDDRLVVVDDGGTPLNREDDTEMTVAASLGTFATISKIVLDADDRCWLLLDGANSVNLIENISALVPPDFMSGAHIAPDWQTLFNETVIRDLAVEKNGLWLGETTGLTYLYFGTDVSDMGDDIVMRIKDVPPLTDMVVSHVTVDALGHKWISTSEGIITLDDGGAPLDPEGHLWRGWSVATDSAVTRTGPVVAAGPDGAKWLQSTWGALVRVDDSDSAHVKRTDYAPRNAAGWSDISLSRNVTTIALDAAKRKWLTHEGMLYILDDKGTPMDSSDDVWTRVEKRVTPSVDKLSDAVPDAHGGAWVQGAWNSMGAPGCTDELIYVSPGDFSDGFDDVAVPYRDYVFGNNATFCGTIHGIDAQGMIWFGDSASKWTEVKTFVLNDNGTPLNPDDDAIVEYNDNDESAFVHSVIGFDPQGGIWVNGGYFSTSDSLSDTADDLFIPIAPSDTGTASLMSVSVDAGGYRWFGYNATNTQAADGVAIGLQCHNDGGTLENTADDTWTTFSPADGMPFPAMTEVQSGGAGLLWIRKSVDQNRSPQFCGLDYNATPMDKTDDRWIVVYMGYNIYHGNAALFSVTDFEADDNADVWFGTSYGIQYLHLND